MFFGAVPSDQTTTRRPFLLRTCACALACSPRSRPPANANPPPIKVRRLIDSLTDHSPSNSVFPLAKYRLPSDPCESCTHYATRPKSLRFLHGVFRRRTLAAVRFRSHRHNVDRSVLLQNGVSNMGYIALFAF